jgi:nitroreductase
MEIISDIENNSKGNTSLNMSFREVVRRRKSCRGFLSTVVPDSLIHEILEEAQLAPSNCNIQPWVIHIVSGDKLRELSAALLRASDLGQISPDFPLDLDEFYDRYSERRVEQGKAYYEGLVVDRNDKEGRKKTADLSFSFFNAPQAAMLFMPTFGNNFVRVAGDVGMYAQNFLLSLTDHGLAGIPQASVGFFADTVREVLGIPDHFKMLFSISFGYADPNAQGNRIKMGRDPIENSVTFHK